MQEQIGLDVTTAAHRLGISPTAVRRRIQRNTLRAFKASDGTWRIVLPGTPSGGPADSPEDAPTGRPLDADTFALLRDQLTEKDRQLREGEVERAELRRLLGNAQQQMSLLLAATSTDASATPHRSEDDLPPPIPNAAPVVAGREIEASQRAPRRSSWWSRLLGWE